MPARFPRPPGRVHSSPRPLVIRAFLFPRLQHAADEPRRRRGAVCVRSRYSREYWSVVLGPGRDRPRGLRDESEEKRPCEDGEDLRHLASGPWGLAGSPCPPASRRLNQIPPQEGQRLVHEAQPWSTPSPLPRDKAAAQRGQAPFRRPRWGGTAWVRALLLPSGLPPSPPRACRLWGPASLVRHTCLVSCG